MSGTPESPAPLRMAGPDEITVRIRRLPDGRVAVQYRERFDPSRFTPAEWGSIVGSAARADRVVLPALRTYGLEARMAPWEARGGPWQGE